MTTPARIAKLEALAEAVGLHLEELNVWGDSDLTPVEQAYAELCKPDDINDKRGHND